MELDEEISHKTRIAEVRLSILYRGRYRVYPIYVIHGGVERRCLPDCIFMLDGAVCWGNSPSRGINTMKKIRTNIHLTEEQRSGLALIAKRTGNTNAHVVRMAINEYIKKFNRRTHCLINFNERELRSMRE